MPPKMKSIMSTTYHKPNKLARAKDCIQCGTYFSRQAYSPARWALTKFCSVICQYENQTKKVEVKCDTCNKSYKMHRFRLKAYKKHFCSFSCKTKDSHVTDLYKQNKKPFLKGSIPWNLNGSHSEESKQKMSDSAKGKLVGDKNPSWKGGITKLIQKIKRLTEYKVWCRTVLERDEFTCRKCGVNGVRLEPHHLASFSYLLAKHSIQSTEEAIKCGGLWNTENGVALCLPCHKLTPNYSFRATKTPIDTNTYHHKTNTSINDKII